MAHHFTSEFTWKRKTFAQKKENSNEQESKKENIKNGKPAAHNNDERSRAAKLVSKITVCEYLCVCVCVRSCVCVACLHYFYAHAWPQAHTNLRSLTSTAPQLCPEKRTPPTDPNRMPPPHPEQNPAQLNSARNRTEQNRTKPKPSRVASRLQSRASSQLSSSSLPMAWGWHRQQKHENFATNSERNQKNNKPKVPCVFIGVFDKQIPWN